MADGARTIRGRARRAVFMTKPVARIRVAIILRVRGALMDV
jgi:hypothetical protein